MNSSSVIHLEPGVSLEFGLTILLYLDVILCLGKLLKTIFNCEGRLHDQAEASE